MTRPSERATWLLAAILLVVAGWRSGAQRAPQVDGTAVDVSLPAVSRPRVVRRGVTIIARDPFRLERAPALARFGQQPAIPQAVERRPRPRPSLLGVTGPPWRGLLGGLPGRDRAVVVRRGDSIGDLRIMDVRKDTVIVTGLDTTWVLVTRRVPG